MKQFNFKSIIAITAVAVASAFGLSSCDKDDNIDIPVADKPTLTQGNFNPDLEGIWLHTANGVIGGCENPVAIENSSLWVLDPANGVGAIYCNQKGREYFELGINADADNLTIRDGSSQQYDKMSYKLVNKDSLIIISESAGGVTNYSSYSRLKEAEALAKNQAVTRSSGGSLQDKVVPGITTLANKIDEKAKDAVEEMKNAASLDAQDALSISMDELNSSRTEDWTYTDWMSKLPDNTPLSHISIPGTHDACTASIGFVGKSVNADCQSLSLEKQLEAGVRCFDIRTSLNCDSKEYDAARGNVQFLENALGTYHGNLSCDISFHEVLRKMQRYLRNHKNETVILRLAFENKNIGFWQSYDEEGRIASTRAYHDVMRDKEFIGDIMPYYPTDMLGSVRGKILVMNYNSHGLTDNDRVGSYVTGYDDNKAVTNSVIHKYEKKNGVVKETASCVFWEQNYYSIGYFSDRDRIELKKNSINDFAVNANKQQDIPLFITQLNANTGNVDLNCRGYAGMFNSYAFQMLWNNMHSNNAALKGGIYSMDYAGVEIYKPALLPYSVYGERLVWAVIENNFHK